MIFHDDINHIYKNIRTNVTRQELTKLRGLTYQCYHCVEIGSYLGASAYAICSGFNDEYKRLYCIDTWESNTELRPDPKSGLSLFDEFKHNTERYNIHIKTIKDYSDSAYFYFIENEMKIDFLFLDGDHTEKGFKKDYDLYFPLLRKGGVIICHDYGWASVKTIFETYIRHNLTNVDNLPNMIWGYKI